MDGQPIENGTDIPALIRQALAADELTLEILRCEATQLLTVRPDVEAAAS
jgi:hypothetical protein